MSDQISTAANQCNFNHTNSLSCALTRQESIFVLFKPGCVKRGQDCAILQHHRVAARMTRTTWPEPSEQRASARQRLRSPRSIPATEAIPGEDQVIFWPHSCIFTFLHVISGLEKPSDRSGGSTPTANGQSPLMHLKWISDDWGLQR